MSHELVDQHIGVHNEWTDGQSHVTETIRIRQSAYKGDPKQSVYKRVVMQSRNKRGVRFRHKFLTTRTTTTIT